MALNTTSVLANNDQIAYKALSLMSFEPSRVFDRIVSMRIFSGQGADPYASKKVKFPIYNALNSNTTALSESVDPTSKSISNNFVEIEAFEQGDVVSTTRLMQDISYQATIPFAPLVSTAASRTMDLLARQAFDSQTGSEYVTYTNGSAKTSIGASHINTISDYTNAFTALRSENVKGFEKGEEGYVAETNNEEYIVVLHPRQHADLKTEVGAGAWRTPMEYGQANKIFSGEFGRYDNCTFVTSALATVDFNAGAGTATAINNGNITAGQTVISVDSGAAVTGAQMTIVTGTNSFTYKVVSISSNDVTIGKCIAKNNEPFVSNTAGLQAAIVDGDVVKVGVNVYTSYVVGAQAIGKTVVVSPEFPVTKPSGGLERQFDFGYYFNVGFGEIRPESLHKIYSAATNG